MTPSAYAQAIFSDSQIPPSHSRYAGSHLEGLARYLHQAFEARDSPLGSRTVAPDAGEPTSFVTICDLHPSTPQRYHHINSIPEFENKAESLRTSESGHIVFLKGNPSPEWIRSIGAKYQVDPEFFYRHLDFRVGLRKTYALPPLPSASRAIFKLRYTTIGTSISAARTEDQQSVLKSLRDRNRLHLEAYRDKLKSPHELALGDAVVRETSIHDLKHFSIEQDVSIYLGRYHESWAGELFILS